jgi:Oxygenase, catalysing oxidative methylation of damaged DNA
MSGRVAGLLWDLMWTGRAFGGGPSPRSYRDISGIGRCWPAAVLPAGRANSLRQDPYGEAAFPSQAAILPSRPDEDFTGGENAFAEQRPRARSRPMVIRPRQGQGLVCTLTERPVPSATRGSFGHLAEPEAVFEHPRKLWT